MTPDQIPVEGFWEEVAARLAPGVLDEVVEASRAEAASILRATLTAALVEEARRLVAPRLAANIPGKGRTGDAPQPEAPREAGTARGWYVYGVTWCGMPAPDLGGVDGGPLQKVVVADLAAVVSAVDRRCAWGVGSDGEVDMASLAPRAQEHAQVLEAALDSGTVLPFRFGVMYPTLAAVEEFLDTQGGALRSTLRRLESQAEWGLVLEWKGAPAAGRSASVPVSTAGVPAHDPSTGRDYMTQRLRTQAVNQDAGRRARQAALRVHDELAAIASDIVVDQASVSRGKRGMGRCRLLKASYLVERDRADEFRRAAESALGRADGDLGLRGDLTGPWPPYNFSDLVKESLP